MELDDALLQTMWPSAIWQTADSENAMIFFDFFSFCLPAAECQPVGSMPVCTRGMLNAITADGRELF